jgi:hypothetical protein
MKRKLPEGSLLLSGQHDQSKSYPDVNIFISLFLILTLVGLMGTIQNYYVFFDGPHSAGYFIRILSSRMIYYWFFLVLAGALRWLSMRIPLKSGSVLRWAGVHSFTLATAFLVHQAVSFQTDRVLQVGESSESFSAMLFDNPSIWSDVIAYCLLLLIFSLVEYKRRSRENEIRCSEMEVELIRSQLDELRSKIHPQFLFAALTAISDLLKKRREREANQFLALLSDFLRTTVYEGESEETTFEDELRFLSQYLAIEKLRLRSKFIFRRRIGREVLNALVPCFIFQQILEELIYSKVRIEDSRLEVLLTARTDRSKVRIIIEAIWRGGRQGSDIDHHALLANTRERLFRLYGNTYCLDVRRQQDGVAAEMNIPFREYVSGIDDVSPVSFALENNL